MNNLYALEAKSIKFLQDALPNAAEYFTLVTEIANPAKAFSIIFPVSCVLNLSLGVNVLAVSVVAEWTNILLKWLLMEHRPYWWVNLAPGRTILKQTISTCESGPGSPSGHVTGMTAVCFVIAQWLCKLINEETLVGRLNKRRLNRFIWSIVWLGLINVTLSRMYHATHFPHQCLLGIGAGYVIGNMVTGKYSKWWKSASRSEIMLISFLFAVIGFTAYLIQILLGVNPDWSIELASSWCSKSEYLQVSTMPFFSLVRDIGASFGIALCSPVSKRVRCPHNRSISAIMTFLVYVALQMAVKEIPTSDPKVFYSSHFMLNAIQPFFMLVAIPYASFLVSDLKSK